MFNQTLFTQAERDNIDAIRKRVRENGFTQREIDQLKALGWSDAEIVDARGNLSTPITEAPVDKSLTTALNDSAAQLRAESDDVAAFARAAAVASTQDAPEPEPQAPSASFTAVVPDENQPRKYKFDGSSSFDPDGSIAAYEWNFGDGSTATGATPEHEYQAPGSYQVNLTVRDNSGLTATTSSTVTVQRQAPTAVLNLAVDNQEPLKIVVDGSGSTADGGQIQLYEWDFGDGKTAQGAKVQHTYAKSGTYTVKLNVTDDAGLKASASTQVTVKAAEPPANEPPTAAFSFAGETVAPATLAFDASTSSDSDGTIATYDWNFGDGSTAKGAKIQHEYKKPGTFAVKLRVTDDDGAWAETTTNITIVKATPPATSCQGLAATIIGDGSGVIQGTKKADVIVGTSADEVIRGGAGDDVICAGAGNDRVEGEKGDDVIDGGDGNDSLYGGSGDDTILGAAGNDTIVGDTGDDFLRGGAGQDRIDGGNGHDQVSGEADADHLLGGNGRDSLRGGDGNDVIYGGARDDVLHGEAGDDSLNGEAGDDWLHGGPGADVLDGGPGRNTLIQE
ncbi:PKD domain-containing protein [Kineosporia babensis]|uniref:PKD domain-containing protein n=1 Tax=Kineosporia babensis TaxID=499548 RepID=UPI002F353ED3